MCMLGLVLEVFLDDLAHKNGFVCVVVHKRKIRSSGIESKPNACQTTYKFDVSKAR